jgi:hypothetical protein
MLSTTVHTPAITCVVFLLPHGQLDVYLRRRDLPHCTLASRYERALCGALSAHSGMAGVRSPQPSTCILTAVVVVRSCRERITHVCTHHTKGVHSFVWCHAYSCFASCGLERDVTVWHVSCCCASNAYVSTASARVTLQVVAQKELILASANSIPTFIGAILAHRSCCGPLLSALELI